MKLRVLEDRKKDRDELFSVATFAANRLGLRDSHVQVTIKLVESTVETWRGSVVFSGNPLDLLIKVRRDQTKNDVIETVFHELVHVRQIVSGDLLFRGQTMTYRKVDFPTCDPKILSEETYFSLPWEVEARRVAEDLMSEWLESSMLWVALKKLVRRFYDLLSQTRSSESRSS